MIDINLLPPANLLTARQKQLGSQLLVAAVSFGLVILLALAMAFSLEFVGKSRLTALSTTRTDLGGRFEANVLKLERLFSLKDKIIGIRKVQSVRPDPTLAISKLTALSVDGVGMTKMSLSADGSLSFAVTVRDVAALSAYLSKLESEEARRFFKELHVQNLQMNQDGAFSFSVVSIFNAQI
jgi:hypothetical protein